MPNFTKCEMLAELQTILLFEADHIRLGASEEIAESFIGFPLGDASDYLDLSSSLVDLRRFAIARSFEEGYDYAFRPSVLNGLGEHEVQDLNEFMRGTPRASASGDIHTFMTAAGMCQTVADAVHARWMLEGERTGPFSTRQLALLADMTEGAVRNALADKSEAGLRAIPGSKNPIQVEHTEALRWLRGRRGFIPAPTRPLEDRFLQEHMRGLETSTALGQLIYHRTVDEIGSEEDAAATLGWPRERFMDWVEGRQAFDEVEASLLADTLGFDKPSFLGKVLEVVRRRDARPGGSK